MEQLPGKWAGIVSRKLLLLGFYLPLLLAVDWGRMPSKLEVMKMA